jgi:hypothetical protein
VCVVYDVGETADGLPFIAMEFVEGQSLDLLVKQGPLPVIRIKVRHVCNVPHQRHVANVPHGVT